MSPVTDAVRLALVVSNCATTVPATSAFTVTRYAVMALPPGFAGAFQVTDAVVPVMAVTVGALGAAGVVPVLMVTLSAADVDGLCVAEPE